MASVQDRFNVNRVALDKWTKREQLCLASAVSCSGDQNWMTVSRSLKLLCGAHHPPDWFSQKLCAVKYGELLENVETPKRKKRTTSDNASSVVETPTDSILRRLTDERIQELKCEIREQQETYAKLYTDVVHLQTGNSNEEQIRAMWMEIEREQEQDRQIKARKQIGIHDMQRNCRQGQFQQQKPQTPTLHAQQEQDMDIDETCKPQGTSPLLSSLLKSSSPAPQVGTTTTTNTTRVNAPTITNLLKGGVVSSSLESSSPSSSQQSSLLAQVVTLSNPLTGPAPGDSSPASAATILTPSQSAPTLSMLLEKNKPSRELLLQQPVIAAQQLEEDIKAGPQPEPIVAESDAVKEGDESELEDENMPDGILTPTKEEEQQLMEVFKNLMPETIDELADILTSNNGILVEESILLHSIEGVESLIDEAQEVDEVELETKLSVTDVKEVSKNPQSMEDSGAKIKTTLAVKNESEALPSVIKSELENLVDGASEAIKEPADEIPKVEDEVKIETISSDDSSDNEPLSAHTKDATAVSADPESEKAEAANIPPKQPLMVSPDDGQNQTEPDRTDIAQSNEGVLIDDDLECNTKSDPPTTTPRKTTLSDSSDVIIIPTDDESNDEKLELQLNPSHQNNISDANTSNKEEDRKLIEIGAPDQPDAANRESPFLQEQTITSICLPDTDDDSSTFEAPIATPKDEKSNIPKQPSSNKRTEENRHEEEAKHTLAVRKLRDRDRSESPLVEDDTSDHSFTVRSRRRYSSTPLDSIPNSPASSEDREFKVWKKSLMTVYNNLLTNKNAAIFLRPFNEEQNPRYKEVCHRPMDLQIIKRHIENGTIKSVTDFQRDVFLMCNNAVMVFKENSSYVNMARELMQEFIQLKEQIIDAKAEKEKLLTLSSSSPYTHHGIKVRGSARKSQRLP